MATKQCAGCQKHIHENSLECKFCGLPCPAPMSPYNPKNFLAIVIPGVIAAAIFIYFASVGQRSKTEPTVKAANACPPPLSAFFAAQDFVEHQLKSPKTAEFDDFGDSSVNRTGDCTYIVAGNVHSQNSFGALMKAAYAARIEYKPETEKWHELEIKVE